VKLIEQIKADRMVAFKNQEHIKKNILGCLIAESSKESKDPSDEKILSTIKKFIDGSKEIQAATSEGSNEFFQAVREEEILSEYRPSQLTEDEVRVIIKHLGEMDLKGIMAHFKTYHAGQYDGKMVSTIVKESFVRSRW
jgi:uncharacterized protein YqeY